MDAVVDAGSVMSYLSLAGAVPVMVTVLFVPTPAESNRPDSAGVNMMASPFRMSPSFHVTVSSASALVSYTLSFAVTIAVTGFFSARNDQVSETSP